MREAQELIRMLVVLVLVLLVPTTHGTIAKDQVAAVQEHQEVPKLQGCFLEQGGTGSTNGIA